MCIYVCMHTHTYIHTHARQLEGLASRNHCSLGQTNGSSNSNSSDSNISNTCKHNNNNNDDDSNHNTLTPTRPLKAQHVPGFSGTYIYIYIYI